MNNGKICVSVCAATRDEMLNGVRQAGEFADVIELRFDCLDKDEFSLDMFHQDREVPWIATFRSREQGGSRELSMEEREAFWNSRFLTNYIDVEEDIIANVRTLSARIVSHHDHSRAPADVDDIYRRLCATGAEIVKIAITAADAVDGIPVWKLLDSAREEGRALIPIAMGDAGKWTRVLGLAHGAFMTYGSLGEGSETAPGQLAAQDLRDVYRVRELDRDTKVFGVIGDPVSQSLSAYMHNPAFASAAVNAVFLPLQVSDLDAFMRRMVLARTREVELNFGGFSVTMPHKQAIMQYLDAIDPTAKEIGAVNTIKVDGDKLTGYNTDAHGFITPLKERLGDLSGMRVAMFGAGGAARACVFALKRENAEVTVVARDAAKAKAFAAEFGAQSAGFGPDVFDGLSARFDIVVDATPMGMKGPLENESLLTADQLKGVKFVYDLVTKPSDTPLLAEAKIAGVPAIGGVEMLVAQGTKQFDLWTGRSAPAEEMMAAVRSRLRQVQK